MLEYCRRHRAAFVLLSTSRVYSITPLAALPLRVRNGAFEPDLACPLPAGLTAAGVREDFSTAASGVALRRDEARQRATRARVRASLWLPGVDQSVRCPRRRRPVRAARPGHLRLLDQQLASPPAAGLHRLWRPGYQVRDCLHPADLVPLLERQIASVNDDHPRVANVGGGRASAISLCQLSEWCRERFGDHAGDLATGATPVRLALGCAGRESRKQRTGVGSRRGEQPTSSKRSPGMRTAS